jgi:hypothetical protein
MAFDASALYLGAPGAPGANTFFYRTTDTMATVLPQNAAGYFDYGPQTAPRLVAGDLVFAVCSDGNMWLKVASTSDTTGICVMQFAGGNLPVRTWATGTAAGDFPMLVGYYEVGTSIATGTRGTLPVPYPGAEIFVRKNDSGTELIAFDAGASAADNGLALSASGGATGGGTGVTYDGTNREIVLSFEGEYFHVRGTSTSRWRLVQAFYIATSDGCASVIPQEGGSRFLKGT